MSGRCFMEPFQVYIQAASEENGKLKETQRALKMGSESKPFLEQKFQPIQQDSSIKRFSKARVNVAD